MKTCLFAGTFDPITIGHYDTVIRLLDKYEKVVVAIGVNPEKTPLFSLEDRLEFIKGAFSNFNNVMVDSYDCLTVSYMQEKNIKVLVRGIRNQTDFEFEKENEKKSKEIYPQLVTEYVVSPIEDKLISSTFVRNQILSGKDFSSLVPNGAYGLIRKAIERTKEKK